MGLEKINDYKKAKGYTNKMLSELTGISISSLDKITSGENTNPKLGTIRLICKALDCNMDDLLGEENNSSIASNEIDIIKKYRKLDLHGAKIVDLVLNEEYERCIKTKVPDTSQFSDDDIIETPKGKFRVAHAAAFGGGTMDILIPADVSYDEINRLIEENEALQRRRENEKVGDELIDIINKNR